MYDEDLKNQTNIINILAQQQSEFEINFEQTAVSSYIEVYTLAVAWILFETLI